jgi:hypothetical protein
MESAIGVGAEMRVVSDMLARGDARATGLLKVEEETDAALESALATGLIDETLSQRVEELRQTQLKSAEQLTKSQESWAAARTAFDATTAEFVAFGREVERLGDWQIPG